MTEDYAKVARAKTQGNPLASNHPLPIPDPRPRFVTLLTRPFQEFFDREASSSVLLLAMTVIALVWANSPFHESYHYLFHGDPADPRHSYLSVVYGPIDLSMPLGHWINDALMTIFFFVVGMEIKREMAYGELSRLSKAMLPVVGALGGMVVPAGIYLAFHWGGAAARGWGVPMATDIAFAVAALSVFGSRVPPGLKIFLLALAIADDIGAVAVIAVFYTSDLHVDFLFYAIGGLVFIFAMNKLGIRTYMAYLAVGAVVWYLTHHSGVHATIAGVAMGFLTPANRPLLDEHHDTVVERGMHLLERLGGFLRGGEDDHTGHERHYLTRELQFVGRVSLSPLDHLTNLLHPWVAFFIMPVFALANAGVAFSASTLEDPTAFRVGLGVALGLVVGKPIGITVFAWLAVKIGLAELPRSCNWTAIMATGVLAGIGFTVALFVTSLAFQNVAFVDGSKIGILVGSFTATTLGIGLLSRALPPVSS